MSDQAFIVVWQGAATATAAAKALGLSYQAARSRASRLRKRGVPLKRFARGTKASDVDALRAVAEAAAK